LSRVRNEEEAANHTIRERLVNDPQVIRNLLNPDRPLGNIAPQIDLLYLLGAFDDTTRKALKGLAGVRNFFAHHADAAGVRNFFAHHADAAGVRNFFAHHLDTSFDSLDEDFAAAMKRLTLHEGKTHYPHHLFGPDSKMPIENVTSRRDQFLVNLKLGLIALMRDRISHHEHSNRFRTDEEMLRIFPDRCANKP
jgi:hypothetical protein